MSKQEQVTPNRLEVAKGQMAKILKTGQFELPETINKDEEKLFHVALVESRANTKTMEFDHKLTIQMYNDRSWYQAKNNLSRIGRGQVYIFHDPTFKGEKEGEGAMSYEELLARADELGYKGKKLKKVEAIEFIAQEEAKLAELKKGSEE